MVESRRKREKECEENIVKKQEEGEGKKEGCKERKQKMKERKHRGGGGRY